MNELEKNVLDKLLFGDIEVLGYLKNQLAYINCFKRQMSGTGFFTEFTISEKNFFIPNLTFKLGDVSANIDTLKSGAGFLLYIENGLLSMMEGYSYAENWPPQIDYFELGYIDGKRDTDKLNALNSMYKKQTT